MRNLIWVSKNFWKYCHFNVLPHSVYMCRNNCCHFTLLQYTLKSCHMHCELWWIHWGYYKKLFRCKIERNKNNFFKYSQNNHRKTIHLRKYCAYLMSDRGIFKYMSVHALSSHVPTYAKSQIQFFPFSTVRGCGCSKTNSRIDFGILNSSFQYLITVLLRTFLKL